MRALFFIGLVVLTAQLGFSQKSKVKNDPTHDDKPVHFGFSIGLNFLDYRIEPTREARVDRVYIGLEEISPGINIHAISNFRLMENLDFRALPGISFGERYLYFKSLNPDVPDEEVYEFLKYKVESSFLELPLMLKYKAKRQNNFRPYLLAGGTVRYDLANKREYDIQEQLLMIDPLEGYVDVGFGMDFYMPYFKLGTEIKYSHGLENIIRRSDRKGDLPEEFKKYTDYIRSVNSHVVIISFHFE